MTKINFALFVKVTYIRIYGIEKSKVKANNIKDKSRAYAQRKKMLKTTKKINARSLMTSSIDITYLNIQSFRNCKKTTRILSIITKHAFFMKVAHVN